MSKEINKKENVDRRCSSIRISVFMICLFSVSFIVFDYIIHSNIVLGLEDKALTESQFAYEECIRIKPNDIKEYADTKQYIKSFVSELNQEGTVIRISDFWLETRPEFEDMKGCDIYLSQVSPRYPLYKGAYPSKEQLESGNAYAVISYSKKGDVYTENGRNYIDFNSETFEVTGYLSKYSEWLVYNRTMLFCGETNDVLWDWMASFLKEGYLHISIESDNPLEYSESVDEINNLAKEISQGAFYVEKIMKSDKSYPRFYPTETIIKNTKVPTEDEIMIAHCIYLFGILILCFMVEKCFKTRKHELDIVAENGYKLKDIILSVYKKLLLLSFVGVVVGKIVECIIIVIRDGYIAVNSSVFYNNFVIMFCYCFITILLSSVFSSIKFIVSNKLKSKVENIPSY